MDLDGLKGEAPKEVVKMAAYLLAFAALLNYMGVAKKADVDDVLKIVQQNEYRQNIIVMTYQMREGVTLFGWTIQDDFAGPMPVEGIEPE